MKFSSKIQRCELSPMRKFLPYELAAEAKGRKIYHLNICLLYTSPSPRDA